MILTVDTYYFEDKAKTVGIFFTDWTDEKPTEVSIDVFEGTAEYVPGEFYKREMPCILQLLSKIDLSTVDILIIDGFVHLDDAGKLGLGGYVYNELDQQIPVIGVAKSGYHNNKKMVRELLRGNSQKPLYVSSIGIDLDEAFEKIKRMHGTYRIPTLLQIMDTKTKEGIKHS